MFNEPKHAHINLRITKIYNELLWDLKYLKNYQSFYKLTFKSQSDFF